MIAERYPEISELPIEEKRELLAELCDQVAMADGENPNPNIVKILEQRWAEHTEDPSGAITLEEFRSRIGTA